MLTETEFDEEYATMFPLYAAEYLNIAAYVREHFPRPRSDALLAFTEERPRRCPFLGSENECTIYPVRPQQCRNWPFWDSNLETPEAWQEVQVECPGAGHGQIYSVEAIQEMVSQDEI